MKLISKIMGIFLILAILSTSLQPLTAQDLTRNSGLAIYEVVDARSKGAPSPFKYEAFLTKESVSGYFVAPPVVSMADVSSMKATTREIATKPVEGILVKFDRSKLKPRMANLRKNVSGKGYLICFGGVPRSVISANTLCNIMEDNDALFVIIPIRRSIEFEELKRQVSNMMASKDRNDAK